MQLLVKERTSGTSADLYWYTLTGWGERWYGEWLDLLGVHGRVLLRPSPALGHQWLELRSDEAPPTSLRNSWARLATFVASLGALALSWRQSSRHLAHPWRDVNLMCRTDVL